MSDQVYWINIYPSGPGNGQHRSLTDAELVAAWSRVVGRVEVNVSRRTATWHQGASA